MKTKQRRGFKCICWLAIVSMAAIAQGALVDDFSVPHNYLIDGSTSFWDGYTINEGVQTDLQDAVVNVLEAADGKLTLTTSYSDIQGRWDDGLALFTTIPAGVDFTATVKVVGGSFSSLGSSVVYYNGGGLLARGTDVPAEQDSIALVAFDMPGWNAVYLWSSNDNGSEAEEGIGPSSTTPISTIAAYPWQRITRVGSVFTAYVSADGMTWKQIGSTWDRPDLAGQLEVGLHQCTYTDATGSAVFDDFSLDYGPAAYAPVPKSRQGMITTVDNPLFSYVPLNQVLSWSAPSDPNLLQSHTVTYDVYLSGGADPNIFLVSDNQEGTSYTPPAEFPMDTTYTWYVESTILMDDANDVTVVKSPVWSFHTLVPNLAPVADAGVDLYTWPDAGIEPDPAYITVTLDGSATDDGEPAGSTLAYHWEVDHTVPEGYETQVLFSDADIANPVVSLPAAVTGAEYYLKLTVTEVHPTEPVKSDNDIMIIWVRPDSCEAAMTKSGENAILADVNGDCILNLIDFAAFAQDWLRNTNLVRPE
ncbi:MAG: hypothetical protein ABFD91_16385 [Anaerohalosphaeraceae bacterium]